MRAPPCVPRGRVRSTPATAAGVVPTCERAARCASGWGPAAVRHGVAEVRDARAVAAFAALTALAAFAAFVENSHIQVPVVEIVDFRYSTGRFNRQVGCVLSRRGS